VSTLNQPTASSPAGSARELEAILEAAALLGAEKIRQQALNLEERARAQRFYVACLGQFKRGKSTLLDALVGLPVLPTGILPVTAVPTVVRYGSAPAARIQLQPGEWKEIQTAELGAYVAEEQNPGNSKGVAAVEVFIPSQLLASGMCLVDTPGLGSIFASNTEAARAFVPHVDAAILVTGADPPLSADELSLAAAVAAHVKDIIVVLNKADRVTEAERLTAKEFAQLIFYKHLGQKTGPILEISATEWLQSGKPTRDGAKLVRNLQELASGSGAALAQGAWERGMQRLRLELRSMICERLGALTRPLEESRERLAALRERVEMAKSSLRDLAPLLTAEQQRMANIFAERRAAFMAATLPSAHDELQQQIARIEFRSGPKYRRDLMRLAQDTARRAVLPWLEKEQTNAADLYSKTMARFTALAQRFVASFDKSLEAIEEAQLSSVFQYGEELTSKSEFRFYDMIRVARPVSPFGLLRDFVLCVMRVRQPFIRDAERFLEQLLEVNSWRVENDFKERVASSRQGLEKHIRSLLNEMVDRVESAVLAAQETINRGESAVETGIDRLRYMEQRLLAKASA
jgi:GTP-binding protein EngB required for normal cell division